MDVRDLEQFRDINPRRWTDAELGVLQMILNRGGLNVVSDAIGSLMFDKVELKHRIEELIDDHLM